MQFTILASEQITDGLEGAIKYTTDVLLDYCCQNSCCANNYIKCCDFFLGGFALDIHK
jgi:hypothetical protein